MSTSLIPNRKPTTPLMAFHGTGIYNKNFKYQTKRQAAYPSTAASLNQRNPKSFEEINVKPSLHDRFNQKFYLPG